MKKLLLSLGLLSSLSTLQAWSDDYSATAVADGSVDISGLDKVEVLRALYAKANSRVRGKPLTYLGAMLILAEHHIGEDSYGFDYVNGRAMKIGFDGDRIPDTWGFNRDNGDGAAESAIAELRAAYVP